MTGEGVMTFSDGTGIKGTWNDCNVVYAETLDLKVIISQQSKTQFEEF